METNKNNTSQNNYIKYSEKEESDFMKIIEKEMPADLNSEGKS